MTTAQSALLKKFKEFISTADIERPKSWISLGPLSVNLAVGDVRGVQTGKLIQIVGKQSSGKSTLALDIAAQHQKGYGLPVVYIDFERSFDMRYAQACGVDLRNLYIVRADTTEQGLNIVEEAIKSGDIKLVIIDSIAAAMPSSEVGKDYEDSPKMASNAGLITRFCNRIIPLLDNNDALLLVLNQTRQNFSTLSQEKEVPFGGNALQFATSVTLHTAKIETKDTFQKTQVIVKKNKTSSPQGRADFLIQYGHGIRHNLDILELAIKAGVVTQRGSYYDYNELQVQGKERAAIELPIEEIKQRIMEIQNV